MGEGLRVWSEVQTAGPASEAMVVGAHDNPPGGYAERLTKVRIGQASSGAEAIQAYGRACAVTREHSLPVVEAAHIVPFAERGVHEITNGLALRSDLHRLFDAHYLTFDEDHRLIVSRRLREEFSNGKAYYDLQEQGARLHLPERAELRPDPALLDIHRERFARLAG